MPRYLSPGVFIKEVPSAPRPIVGGGTNITCFLGQLSAGDGPVGVPVFLTSYAEFLRHFGQTVDLTTEPFAAAIRGFFENGGSRAYVVRIASGAAHLTQADIAVTANINEISLIACPSMTDVASHEALISHCENRTDRFAILDISNEFTQINATRRLATQGGARPRDADDGVAAAFAPWIDVPSSSSGATLRIGPSGHVCGAYARNDINRGVHRTPANLSLRGVVGLAQNFSSADVGLLTTAHINAIRTIPGRGIKIWGGRTLSSPANEFKYVAVRRFATFVHEAISAGTQWTVFEPNNQALWSSIRREVSAFLALQWRQGALRGVQQHHAFFVQCGTDTMSQNDLDSGRLTVLIGIAPVKPAEFVIIRIQQKSG